MAFVELAQAMVPRGMVDTELDAESITGGLELVATAVEENRVVGTIEGSFGLKPKDKSEVGKRANAAVLFFAPRHQIGIEWVRGPATVVR